MQFKMITTFAAMAVMGSALAAGNGEALKQAEMEAYVAKHGALPAHTGPATKPVANIKGTPATRNVPVSIAYDDGVVTASPNIGSNTFGNQFDTANGGAVKSFSVTMQSFYMQDIGGSAAFISIFGPVAGTTAPVLTSVSVPAAAGTFNTATFGTPQVGSGSFLAGVWLNATGTGVDAVGLGSGTVGGQGHHGFSINDIVGTAFATLPGLNALVGASTGFIVPVELMEFSLDD